MFIACSGIAANPLEVIRIEIEGYQKTKEYAILRELDFEVGDTLIQEQLTERFERNRTNLLNTALFTEVSFNIREWDTQNNQIVVTISVSEAWYIYVVPIIDLADRNFNVWWRDYNRDFSRLNLGIYAYHINLTGISDRLRIKGQVGFTPKFDIQYQLPYFNKDRSLGAGFNVFWSSNKEIHYITEENRQVFYRDDSQPLLRRFRAMGNLRYRPNLYLSHELETTYFVNTIDEAIALERNPDFFLNSRTRQQYLRLRYRGEYDERDLQLFPMAGVLGGIEITKEGIGNAAGINSLTITPYFEGHQPLTPRMSIGIAGKGQYECIRRKQPFINNQALGYSRDEVRGYEYYVIDGMDYVYGKGSLRYRLISRTLNWKRRMPKAFRDMSVQVYGNLNYDVGYVNEPYYHENNPLANRILHGGGPGVSLVLYHTFAVHLEYSVNHLGEKGLFLHTKTSF